LCGKFRDQVCVGQPAGREKTTSASDSGEKGH
jgi:hypothetical protein